MATKKELTAQLRQLTKTANQRLRELEKTGYSSSSLAYSYVERLSFDSDDAVSFTQKGQIKFTTAFSGMTIQQLSHELAKVNDFLNSRTSTRTGILAYTEQARETFTSKTGVEMTASEFAEFWTDSLVHDFERLYGSHEVVRLQQIHGVDGAMSIIHKAIQTYNQTGEVVPIMNLQRNDYTQYSGEENPFI